MQPVKSITGLCLSPFLAITGFNILLPANAHATTLTGVVAYDSGGLFDEAGEIYRTTPNDPNTTNGRLLFLKGPSGFLNPGDSTSQGTSAAGGISIPLTPGNYTYQIFGDNRYDSYNEVDLELFFNESGNNVKFDQPNIEAKAPTNSTAFSVQDNSTTRLVDREGNVYNSGGFTGTLSLSYVDGDNTVTLTGFEFGGDGTTDQVGPYQVGPNGDPDYFGSFSINVAGPTAPSDTPEPASAGLMAGGLGMIALILKKVRKGRASRA